MTEIVVDAETAARLQNCLSDVVICGPDGKSLGRFQSHELRQAYEEADRVFSREELDRRDEATETFSTEEVIENLRKGNV